MAFVVVEVRPQLRSGPPHRLRQRSLALVCLEHSEAVAHHSDCLMPLHLAFACSVHLVARWAHLPRVMQDCQKQHSD